MQREAARAEHGPGQGSRYLPVRGSTLVISVPDAIFVDTENLSPEQSLPSLSATVDCDCVVACILD